MVRHDLPFIPVPFHTVDLLVRFVALSGQDNYIIFFFAMSSAYPMAFGRFSMAI